MSYTPLQDAIRTQAGTEVPPTVDYRGATTAARFPDPQLEFAALEHGCGIYDLGFRARISLVGGERDRRLRCMWLYGVYGDPVRRWAAGVVRSLARAQGCLQDLAGAARGWSHAGGQRGAGNATYYGRHSSLRRRHPRAGPSAGNRADARAQL